MIRVDPVQMSSEFLGASRGLVELVKHEMGVVVSPRLDRDLQVGSKALLQEMKISRELVVLLQPDRQDHQYLIAQACLQALASKEAPFKLSAFGDGERQYAQELASRGVDQSQALASHLVSGTGSQLRGAPLIALSALEIYNSYPELRSEQLKYFKLDCAQGAHALTDAPAEFAGPVLDAHLALNGAIASVAGFLFEDQEFFKPYLSHPAGRLSTQLVEDIYGVTPLSDEFDILRSWINKLSLGNFFKVTRERI